MPTRASDHALRSSASEAISNPVFKRTGRLVFLRAASQSRSDYPAPVKILIIGSGGREHALAWKLKQSPGVEQIFCAPGNAGTALGRERGGGRERPGGAGSLRQGRPNRSHRGRSGRPARAGLVDLFSSAGLRVFGPNKTASRLESSKIFAKELMRRRGYRRPRRESFSDSAEAAPIARRQNPIVIKADGLALGKGVVIAQDSATPNRQLTR